MTAGAIDEEFCDAAMLQGNDSASLDLCEKLFFLHSAATR
jgi:hypothetical protein